MKKREARKIHPLTIATPEKLPLLRVVRYIMSHRALPAGVGGGGGGSSSSSIAQG